MTAADQVIALAYLRQRLVQQREAWQQRVDATRVLPDKWASHLQAVAAREAFRIAVLLVDESLEQLEPRKENTKPNAH